MRSRIAEIRKGALQQRTPKTYFWTKRDRMFHGPGVVHYMILDTGGCRWARRSGGCSMCGYANESCGRDVLNNELAEQVDHLVGKMPRSPGPFGLRIFTSGSFLDEEEVSTASRAYIVGKLRGVEGLAELTVESRPEHVNPEGVRDLTEGLPGVEIEVAIGLESSNDWVRESCIGKGFSFQQFMTAARLLARERARCKSYVLVKPPFLAEFDASYDAQHTICDVADACDSVSINSCNVQRGTLVEALFARGAYRPPWIWTVIEVLKAAVNAINPGKNVICDTVAFGTRRGPHNCRRCDGKATAMVNAFSLEQDQSRLEGLSCICQARWIREYHYRF